MGKSLELQKLKCPLYEDCIIKKRPWIYIKTIKWLHLYTNISCIIFMISCCAWISHWPTIYIQSMCSGPAASPANCLSSFCAVVTECLRQQFIGTELYWFQILEAGKSKTETPVDLAPGTLCPPKGGKPALHVAETKTSQDFIPKAYIFKVSPLWIFTMEVKFQHAF